jgi:hypothetical protein
MVFFKKGPDGFSMGAQLKRVAMSRVADRTVRPGEDNPFQSLQGFLKSPA